MSERSYRRQNEEVYYSTDRFPVVGAGDIAFLKARALENQRVRSRICLHSTPDDPLHDMVLVFHNTTYFRPLRHIERSQLFHILEGAMSLVLLDDSGSVLEVIELGAVGSPHAFEAFLSPGVWYSFVLRSEWLVIRETTTGPMTATDRQYAPFSPEENDPTAQEYARDLERRITER